MSGKHQPSHVFKKIVIARYCKVLHDLKGLGHEAGPASLVEQSTLLADQRSQRTTERYGLVLLGH